MNRHNYFFKILIKTNNFINSLLKKNLNKLNNNNLKTLLINNKIFLLIFAIFFLFFSYLSIPNIYNQNEISAEIRRDLLDRLNLEFNFKKKLDYNFLPRPHFTTSEISITSNENEISEIQKIKIYVSLDNLFSLKNIKIKDIIIEEANFNLNKNNYNFFIKLLDGDFKDIKLEIVNSNIFYRNFENEVLFINKINKLKYFYDFKSLENILSAGNEIFNIPYNIKLKHDADKKKIISKINLDFINLQIENIFDYKNSEKLGLLKVSHEKKKSEGTYSYRKNSFQLNFIDKSINPNFNYDFLINSKPFSSKLSGNLDKIDLDILFKSNSILVQFFKTGLFNNKNLDIITKINSKKTSSFKDIINLALNVKISEGLVDINNTNFSLKRYADVKLTNSLLYINNNHLILDALISININNSNDVYKFLQTPRNYRKEIKKIDFNLSYNFDQNIIDLNGIKIDDVVNEKVNKTLNQIMFKDNNYKNKILLKNLINKAIQNYVG